MSSSHEGRIVELHLEYVEWRRAACYRRMLRLEPLNQTYTREARPECRH